MSMAQILRLKPAFTDEQAQALAGLFDEEIASKRDIELLRHDIEALRIATKSDIEALRMETTSDIEALRIGTKSDIERLRAELMAEIEKVRLDVEKLRLEVQRDLKGTEARLIAWVVGQGAATIGILFALLHFVGK